jgi:hypothetical protein
MSWCGFGPSGHGSPIAAEQPAKVLRLHDGSVTRGGVRNRSTWLKDYIADSLVGALGMEVRAVHIPRHQGVPLTTVRFAVVIAFLAPAGREVRSPQPKPQGASREYPK